MPSKPKKQNVLGVGSSVEEAFTDAVPTKSQGKGVVKTLERPSRSTSAAVADGLEGSTDGGWIAIPTSYIESRDHKKENGLAGKRGQVFRFVKQ